MINISKNKCVGCGICEVECPVNCIVVENSVAVIKREECILCCICIEKCPQNAIMDINRDFMLAVGTDDNKTVKKDDHVGMSKFFQIWKYSEGELTFVATRENQKYQEDERKTHGDPAKAQAVSNVLSDIDVLIGSVFGPNITRIKDKYVCAVARCETIEEAKNMVKENINEIAQAYSQNPRNGIILNKS